MRKIAIKLLALILCLSIIPVSPVIADDVVAQDEPVVTATDLIIVEEDFTQYSSLEDIPNLTYTENEHTTLSVDPEKGLVMTQVKSTPLVDGASN